MHVRSWRWMILGTWALAAATAAQEPPVESELAPSPPETAPDAIAPAPTGPAPEDPIEPAPHAGEPAAQPVEMTAVAVLPGTSGGVALDRVPRNVARLSPRTLEAAHPLGLHDAINRRLGSVTLNDVQNNPLQPDLQYRGFTASPLLGSPQGLAVYQNGVRINDPFGDVVQWDLVPQFALHELQVVPGANPLYGLNALGGGLSLQMKNGFGFSGAHVTALAGAFGRVLGSAEYGRAYDDVAVYAGISSFGERGFRDASRSSAHHVYADVRQRAADFEVGVNATIARTELRGNGPLPIELLQQRRSAIYTQPDITRNDLWMLASDARRKLGQHVTLRGNAYLRQLTRGTVNGDEAELEVCDPAAAVLLACDEEAEPLLTEAGLPIVFGGHDAIYNSTETATSSFGAALALHYDRALFGRPNQLAVGAVYDGSASDFSQRVELGHLTQDRGVAGAGIYLGGDGNRTVLEVDTHQAGVFVADTLDLLPSFSLQLAARLQTARIELRDRLGDALDGKHDFFRIDPAVGITYHPSRALTAFASYSESNRAPSAVELACADPEEPCRLPNAFLADPPLEQVVTRALEVGARGQLLGTRAKPLLSWSVAAFGSRNYNDILFVAGSRLGTGFFQNAGNTQRIGLEFGATLETGLLRVFASYTLLRATFESNLDLPGEANPGLGAPLEEDDELEAEAGAGEATMRVLDVEPGDRIPGLPTHSLKAGITVSPLPRLSFGISSQLQSEIPYRGDEANLLAGVPGYAIFSAEASYFLLDSLQLFVEAKNLLDARYETFGLIAQPGAAVEGLSDPRFLGPGAPFGLWAGLSLRTP